MPQERKRKESAAERNDALILDALESSNTALSAYDLIEALYDQGIISPPTVYRSLARLISKGLVHRVESLNTFVSCRNHSHDPNIETLFAICNTCGTVKEISDKKIAARVRALAQENDFSISQTALEMRGSCIECQPEIPSRTRK